MEAYVMRSDILCGFIETGYYFQLTLGRQLLDKPHSHDFYEIIYVMSGSCEQSVCEETRFMGEGDLFILRPPDTHRFTCQSEDVNIAAVSVTLSEMHMFLLAYGLSDDARFDCISPKGKAPRLSVPQTERSAFRSLCAEAFTLTPAQRIPFCKSLLGIIFTLLLRQGVMEVDIPASFAAVLSEMNRLSNAAEGVEAFLRLSNFSHAQLCRLTRRYLDQTPSEYVNSVRMKYAWELITSGELDFETICETVGFRSFSHFCSLFRKTYDMTPAGARKHNHIALRTV